MEWGCTTAVVVRCYLGFSGRRCLRSAEGLLAFVVLSCQNQPGDACFLCLFVFLLKHCFGNNNNNKKKKSAYVCVYLKV